MPSSEHDIVVIGAGAAGLAASAKLSAAGLRVMLVEARQRIGGRIFTLPSEQEQAAIELGAEFVHGRPREIFDLVRSGALETVELTGEHWFFHDGRLDRSETFIEGLEEFFGKMADPILPDQSFENFARYWEKDPSIAKAAPWLKGYVEGFNAAEADLISIHSLVKEARAEEEIEGERQFRIAGGYQRLIDTLQRSLDPQLVTIALNTAVTEIAWEPDQVVVTAQTGNHEFAKFSSRRAIITIPLGVLQQSPAADGAIEFSPDIPEKRRAAKKLAMGDVVRMVFCFREAFWEKSSHTPSAHGEELSRLSFIFSQEKPFPTWWTTFPIKSPLLVAWAAGPNAKMLRGRSPEQMSDEALAILARLLGMPIATIRDYLVSWHFHDWSNDPFSRGAYSYVKVGGLEAQKELAVPIADTLFFAGEATETEGHHATVHGAMATGYRAADEVLSTLSAKTNPAFPRTG